MVLYLSCPAVSQICNLILTPSREITLNTQLIPMVIIQFSTNLPQLYRSKRLLFPTPESPIMMIFCRQSNSSSFLLFIFPKGFIPNQSFKPSPYHLILPHFCPRLSPDLQLNMDIFQLIGDFLHLIAVLMLLLKILANKNVIGLSYKTQELYLVVFLTRYSDIILELHWGSVYFNVMRILFVAVTAYTIYVMRFKRPYKMSYDNQSDAFPHWALYFASAVLAFFFHKTFSLYGIFWSFSIWLEAGAILPQLYMIARCKDIENITAHIVLFLGFYRFFYIMHWIYKWQELVTISFVAGILQTLFYGDFIYYFVRSNQNERIINLPI